MLCVFKCLRQREKESKTVSALCMCCDASRRSSNESCLIHNQQLMPWKEKWVFMTIVVGPQGGQCELFLRNALKMVCCLLWLWGYNHNGSHANTHETSVGVVSSLTAQCRCYTRSSHYWHRHGTRVSFAKTQTVAHTNRSDASDIVQ